MHAKRYFCELEVRGYELDSFGHVNHAEYVRYLEHARWKLLEEESIGIREFKEWKVWPVIAEIQVRYLRPTFLGDRLRVETWLSDHTRTQFQFSQEIYRYGSVSGSEKVEKILEASLKAVMVNERGRPTEIPSRITQLWVKTQ